MKNDYSRPVSMQCSTCGGTEFEFDEDGGPIRCTGCDRIYAKDELIKENGGRIDQHVEEMKSDIMKDVRKDLSDMFKKFK
jgi:DNA-directed RNA polymerase subunit RPC12/RpoP